MSFNILISIRKPNNGLVDTIAPEITDAVIVGENLTMNMDKAGTAYWLLNQSATVLTGAAIKAAVLATTPARYGTKVTTSGGNTDTISLVGLAGGTWYFHIVGETPDGSYLDDFGDVVTVLVTGSLSYVGGSTLAIAGTISNTTISLTSLTGGLAAAPVAGDLVMLFYGISSTSNQDVTVVSAGWTEIADLYVSDTYDANLGIYWKIMSGSPDTSVDVGPTNFTSMAGAVAIQVWRGADPATPIDVTTTTASGTNGTAVTPAAITPVTGNAVILVAASSAASIAAVFTNSELSNFLTVASPDNNDITVGVGSIPWSGGTFTPAAFGGGNTTIDDSWVAATIAIRPQ